MERKRQAWLLEWKVDQNLSMNVLTARVKLPKSDFEKIAEMDSKKMMPLVINYLPDDGELLDNFFSQISSIFSRFDPDIIIALIQPDIRDEAWSQISKVLELDLHQVQTCDKTKTSEDIEWYGFALIDKGDNKLSAELYELSIKNLLLRDVSQQ